MKHTFMRTPGVSQIYSQRIQLQFHKKKLQKIREERKSQLAFDQSRYSQIESFKQSKAKSFIAKFNQNNQAISKQNVMLLTKLEKAKPTFGRYSSFNERTEKSPNSSFTSPHAKQKIIQTEKENIRITNRMKSMSSSLSADKMDQQYQRTLQIKKRLMRFVSDKNRVSLKSEMYMPNIGRQSECSSKQSQARLKSKQQTDKVIKTHYKHEQINKNKIDNSTNTLMKIKQKYRPNTSIDKTDQNGFFTTQPMRKNLLKKKKVFI